MQILKDGRYLQFSLILLTQTLVVQLSRAEDPLDLLFFGNSFTNATCCGSTVSVPNVIRAIAVSAGHPIPNVLNASANGQSMQWHLENNTAVINSGIAAGENWDFVVLQDLSTNPTHIGDRDNHLSSTLAMYQAVAARSPSVVPVMYETWARGPGHSFYTGVSPAFPGGPAQMQQELREGYYLSTANINSTVGMDIARYAPAGDTWEAAGFQLDLYANDIYHASNHGTLLNALVLYGTIYGDANTSSINLATVLTGLKISPMDGQWLTSLADAALVPEPGSLMLVTVALLCAAIRVRHG